MSDRLHVAEMVWQQSRATTLIEIRLRVADFSVEQGV